MKKIIELGKIDYNQSGRKDCLVDIEIKLKDTPEGKVFTAFGRIWNPKKTDCYSSGQNLDEIEELFTSSNKQLHRIVEIWKKYHMNDFHAGCEHQRDYENEPYEKHAGAVCPICHYEYGTGWHFEKIPNNTIKEIEDIILSKS